jgi:hypothetical protein
VVLNKSSHNAEVDSYAKIAVQKIQYHWRHSRRTLLLELLLTKTGILFSDIQICSEDLLARANLTESASAGLFLELSNNF